MPWINDKKQHLYVIRSSASSTVNCKEKWKHVQKSWNLSNFAHNFQALSTLGHLFLPRQRIERNRGVKAEKRLWQEELRSQREFLTSLRLRSSRVFTHAHCSTDSPVTYWEPAPGNKAPNCKHSKCQSQPWGKHYMRTGCHYWCAQRAGAIWLLAGHESRAACCKSWRGQPNDMHSARVMRDTSHMHILIPLVSLQPAGRESIGR